MINNDDDCLLLISFRRVTGILSWRDQQDKRSISAADGLATDTDDERLDLAPDFRVYARHNGEQVGLKFSQHNTVLDNSEVGEDRAGDVLILSRFKSQWGKHSAGHAAAGFAKLVVDHHHRHLNDGGDGDGSSDDGRRLDLDFVETKVKKNTQLSWRKSLSAGDEFRGDSDSDSAEEQLILSPYGTESKQDAVVSSVAWKHSQAMLMLDGPSLHSLPEQLMLSPTPVRSNKSSVVAWNMQHDGDGVGRAVTAAAAEDAEELILSSSLAPARKTTGAASWNKDSGGDDDTDGVSLGSAALFQEELILSLNDNSQGNKRNPQGVKMTSHFKENSSVLSLPQEVILVKQSVAPRTILKSSKWDRQQVEPSSGAPAQASEELVLSPKSNSNKTKKVIHWAAAAADVGTVLAAAETSSKEEVKLNDESPREKKNKSNKTIINKRTNKTKTETTKTAAATATSVTAVKKPVTTSTSNKLPGPTSLSESGKNNVKINTIKSTLRGSGGADNGTSDYGANNGNITPVNISAPPPFAAVPIAKYNINPNSLNKIMNQMDNMKI